MSTAASLKDQIQEVVVPALRPYASRVSLFGSVARGEEEGDSDIDLLVTLRPSEERPLLGLRWFELERELSERLGRSVELVTDRSLSRHVRPHVEPDAVVLYEDE